MLAEVLGRELAPGEVARHTCDNPACCRPDHLVVGTQADNVRDRVERGRSALGRGNGRNVLSENDVFAVRYYPGSLAETARLWGVSKWTVRDIRSGRIWSWLTGQRPRRIPTVGISESVGVPTGGVVNAQVVDLYGVADETRTRDDQNHNLPLQPLRE